MKKIFFYIAAFVPALSMAQTAQPFTIDAKIGKLNTPAKAFLAYRVGGTNITDSATISNGAFKFSGTVAEPANATLFIDYKGVGFAKYVQQNFPDGGPSKTADALTFFVEKGTINIAGADSAKKAVVTGSPVNDDNKKLITLLKPVNDKAQKLMAENKAATDVQKQSADFQNAMQAKFKVLQDEQKNVLRAFIKANPNSYMSLLALGSLGGPSPNPAEIEPVFNSLAQNIQETNLGKSLKSSLTVLKGVSVGSIAPDFTQADVDGKDVSLSSFKGKYVLLDFWASWCGPCRMENPNVVKAYNKYKDKNFTVLGVSLDNENGKSAWLAAIKKDGLTWTQVSDLRYWNNEVAQLYAVQSIPQNFLIDPTGRIIARDLRGADLEAKLLELFGKI
ncbi:TlpA disulfide reductase family protein [Mucilaginibacter gynuensis]|uniref:TlpA disulfide reductase family protein n=1 Tax=Mucilaginibacter gynuensis TaxID=1302236 RepID=A0ABP8H0Y7_9SPHI